MLEADFYAEDSLKWSVLKPLWKAPTYVSWFECETFMVSSLKRAIYSRRDSDGASRTLNRLVVDTLLRLLDAKCCTIFLVRSWLSVIENRHRASTKATKCAMSGGGFLSLLIDGNLDFVKMVELMGGLSRFYRGPCAKCSCQTPLDNLPKNNLARLQLLCAFEAIWCFCMLCVLSFPFSKGAFYTQPSPPAVIGHQPFNCTIKRAFLMSVFATTGV